MNDLDIDETLPGQEIEEDIKEEVIRRETELSSAVKSSGSSLSESLNDELEDFIGEDISVSLLITSSSPTSSISWPGNVSSISKSFTILPLSMALYYAL